MRVFFGIVAALIALAVIFIGYKIRMIDTALSSKIDEQTPHLEILSEGPIVVGSIFKVSAFAAINDDGGPVPIVKIFRAKDGAYQGGKALKVIWQTEVSMLAPSESGAYVLRLGDIEENFNVQPIVSDLSLSKHAYKPGEAIALMLDTNANGNETLTVENQTGRVIETIRNGWDQNFSTESINVSAPLEPGTYKLIYRKSLGEEIASLSFQVTSQ